MKAILNRVKPNMRRLLAFTLACLTAASALAVFTLPATAASAHKEQTLYKWTRVQSQAELEAIKGKTVPVILCWEDPVSGARYVAQGSDSKDYSVTGLEIYRDGRHGGNDGYAYMPAEATAEYKKYYQQNVSYSGNFESYFAAKAFLDKNNLLNFYNKVVSKSKAAWATSPGVKRFYTDLLRDNQHSLQRRKAKTLMAEVAFDADEFYTEKNISDWTMEVGETITRKKATVNFKSGGLYLGYGPAINEYSGRRLDWAVYKRKGAHNINQVIDFELCPSDCGDERSQFTDKDKVQLTCDIDFTSAKGGLCFDNGYFDLLFSDDDFFEDYLDSTNKTRSYEQCYFSNFTLFYGQETKVQVIEGDYTIEKGAIETSHGNLRIAPGARVLIAPGALFTVNGVLVNDGVIDNCGTLVVNEKSSIVSSVVNKNNPSQDKEAGSINCYGGTASFSGAFYREHVKQATAEYEQELKEKQAAADALLDDFNAAWELLKYYTELLNNATNAMVRKQLEAYVRTYQEEYDKVAAKYEPLNRAAIEYEESRDKIIRNKIAALVTSEETTEYTDCAGELIVLKNAGVYMSNNPGCTMNIYEGGTLVNLGNLVLTNGLTVDGGEVRNKEGAYIFAGCHMASSVANMVSVRGSGASATITGMEKTTTGAHTYGYGNYYVENDGTILIHGGSRLIDSDTHISGNGVLQTYQPS